MSIKQKCFTIHTLRFDLVGRLKDSPKLPEGKKWPKLASQASVFAAFIVFSTTYLTVSFPIDSRQQRLLLNNVTAASPQPLTLRNLLFPTFRRKASLTMSSAAAFRRILPRSCSSNPCLNIRRSVLHTHYASPR